MVTCVVGAHSRYKPDTESHEFNASESSGTNRADHSRSVPETTTPYLDSL